MTAARDPRWVLLIETGEYSILGRHREPNESDIAMAEDALRRVGRSGWVAVMSHSAHAGTKPEFVMVRPLRDPKAPFAEAVQAFHQRYR